MNPLLQALTGMQLAPHMAPLIRPRGGWEGAGWNAANLNDIGRDASIYSQSPNAPNPFNQSPLWGFMQDEAHANLMQLFDRFAPMNEPPMIRNMPFRRQMQPLPPMPRVITPEMFRDPNLF